MAKPVRIALDAMGGDFGPSVVVAGAALFLKSHADVTFVMYGNETKIRPHLKAKPELAEKTTVVHTEVAVRMDDKPSVALRQGRRNSSMWLSLDAVKAGMADAAISAGNTGALMAMAKLCLRTLPGVSRPAIAARWPTVRGQSIVLDVGATIGADSTHLVTMTVMGAAMARIILGKANPSVGLLNIGVEEVKGLDEVRKASQILRGLAVTDFAYHGFVEGHDIGLGTVDVVVSEGFSGNIALKSAEGTARQIAQYLRDAMRHSLRAKIGYIFMSKALSILRKQMDPRRANGGVFLGLNGIVVKSHGSTDALGFAGAIEVGYEMVRQNLNVQISESLARAQEQQRQQTDNSHTGEGGASQSDGRPHQEALIAQTP